MKLGFVLVTCFALAACATPRNVKEEAPLNQPEDQGPRSYFVLFHSAGSAWQEGVPPNKQSGLDQHVEYFGGQLEGGKLVLGGPFTDAPGGMMVLDVETPEQAEEIATGDPAVKSGLLDVKVRPWLVPFYR